MGKVWSKDVEVGQNCSEPTSCFTLTLVLSVPVPTHLLWEGSKGWLCTHQQNRAKDLVYARGLHQVISKRKQVRPSHTFPSLSLSFSWSQLQTLQHSRTNAGSEDILCTLFPFSFFNSLPPCFAWQILPPGKFYLYGQAYSTSHIELCCGCRELMELCCGFWASTFE